MLEVGERDGNDPIQPGDVLQLEISLPQFYGVPQRYLYCRCNVEAVDRKRKNTHRLQLTVDLMQFRNEVTNPLAIGDVKTRLM